MPYQRNSLRTRHRGACTNCRQMKLRCDGLERLPAPCSRCESSQKNCVIDRSFRRVARKDRLDELEKDLRELRAGFQKPVNLNNQISSSGNIESASSTDDQIPVPPIDPSERIDLSDSDALVSQYQSSIHPFRLEGTELHPEDIIKHVILFYRHYHENFPILPDIHFLLQNLQTSPLLVWAIVSITSTRLPAQDSLRVKLIDPMKRLAGISIMGGEPPSVFLVQALLLLCNWPMPFKATITDPSWTYCGAAVNIALRIGLHQPAFHFDFIYGSRSDEDAVALRTRTWIACFIMQNRVSLALGLPAMTKIDYTILQNLKSHSPGVSKSLRSMLFLTYKIHNFSNQLGQCEFTKYGLLPNPLSLIQAFEKDLDLFQTRLESKREEIAVLTAKLHLYSYILNPSPQHQESIESAAPIEGHYITYYIGQAYYCASRIINLSCDVFAEDPGIETFEGVREKRQWTQTQTLDLMYAMTVLIWIVKLSETGQNIDAADAIIRCGRNVFKQLVTMDDDHYSRLCDLVDYITSMDSDTLQKSRNSLKRIFVRSRMSANIIWNVVYAAKKRFSERKTQTPRDDELNSVDMALLSVDTLALNDIDANTYICDLGNFDLTWTDWDALLPTSSTNNF
ncbi:hypothetical protein BGW36DRAFT_13366 [Talaromyces proteolyticus]|uniref:Zn(2)-C6 fungal-type domain-containing protein n=1 Tax=Talaromyces proteolyticus TaxID=1131652 RepID=A0AAD4Q1A9_9EURO|nr:uncharacterized protein BGW36DRAFT_13366 [Talaromyces proteolyticus]KAH8705430.1 hypothetical protein BGW36DRAFT_13366 [Talaromyces proteolyticus]